MAKIRANKTGNEKQRGKVTSYSVSISKTTMEASGLTTEDEIKVSTDGKRIIIEKLEAN